MDAVRFEEHPPCAWDTLPCGASLGPCSRRSPPRVLWIDDEVHANDSAVLWMTFEGLSVDCEPSGIGGLQRALTGAYDGIILDLRLPDISGQAVLERLVAAGLPTPVVVLSGYADFADGIAAMKAGAHDVVRKPVMGDELAALMRQAIANEGDRRQIGLRQTHHGGIGTDDSDNATVHVRAVLAMIVSGLSALEYVKLAEQFRCLVTLDEKRSRHRSALHHGPSTPKTNQDVESILRAIEVELAAGRVPEKSHVAHVCRMTAEDLAGVLFTATSLQYRQCRRALRLRPALPEVALAAEQIAQIAYRAGYEHPSQFDRDFDETATSTALPMYSTTSILPAGRKTMAMAGRGTATTAGVRWPIS